MPVFYPSPIANFGSSNIPINNLVALYNIADGRCYTSGSSTITDLSGNGNTLTITGSQITYNAASGSLTMNNSGSSYSGLFTANELQGGNLKTTSSICTIIQFFASSGSGAYDPIWYIGGTTSATNGQITNQQLGNFGSYKISIAGTSGNNFQPQYTQSLTNPARYYEWGSTSPTFGQNKWSMIGSSKQSQLSNYNLRFDMRGFTSASAAWQDTSLLSVQFASGSGSPNVLSGNIVTVFNTNLTAQYLYIGKNPLNLTPTIFQRWKVGGFAIFDTVLTSAQIDSFWDYFKANRT